MTPRQHEVLRAIERSIEHRGYAPTISELQAELGTKGRAAVHAHLVELERQGRIIRAPGRERGIELVVQADSPLLLAQFTTEALLAELRRRGALPEQLS